VSAFSKLIGSSNDRIAPYDDMIPLIKTRLGAYGPQRLMWGSDCPYQLAPGHT